MHPDGAPGENRQVAESGRERRLKKVATFMSSKSKAPRRRSTIGAYLAENDAAVIAAQLEDEIEICKMDSHRTIRTSVGTFAWIFDSSGIYWQPPYQNKAKFVGRVMYSFITCVSVIFMLLELVLSSSRSDTTRVFNSLTLFGYLLSFWSAHAILEGKSMVFLLAFSTIPTKLMIVAKARKALLLSSLVYLLLASTTVSAVLQANAFDTFDSPIANVIFVVMTRYWLLLSVFSALFLMYAQFQLFKQRLSALISSMRDPQAFPTASPLIARFQEVEALLRLLSGNLQFPLTGLLSVAFTLVLLSILDIAREYSSGHHSGINVNFIAVGIAGGAMLFSLYTLSSLTTKMERITQLINIYAYKHLSKDDYLRVNSYIEMATRNSGVAFKLYGMPITGSLTFRMAYLLVYGSGMILYQILTGES